MLKIAIIATYFGKLPSYFKSWLISCSFNPTIDFFVFGDCPNIKEFKIPANVQFIRKRLTDIKDTAQGFFDFPIKLERPYKICDFKPLYGLIFQEYIKYYDFWAHTDIDVIYGNIRKFLPDSILAKYERLYELGHLTFFKNCDRCNFFWKTLNSPNRQDWRKVFSSDKNFSFDERAEHSFGGGLSMIVRDNKIPIYVKNNFLEKKYCSYKIIFYNNNLNKLSAIITCNKKGLFLCFFDSFKFKKQEFLYLHFGQNKLTTDFSNKSEFICVYPKRIVGYKTNRNAFLLSAVTLFKNILIFLKKKFAFISLI